MHISYWESFLEAALTHHNLRAAAIAASNAQNTAWVKIEENIRRSGGSLENEYFFYDNEHIFLVGVDRNTGAHGNVKVIKPTRLERMVEGT